MWLLEKLAVAMSLDPRRVTKHSGGNHGRANVPEFLIEAINQLFFSLATSDLNVEQAEQLNMIEKMIMDEVAPTTASHDQPTPDRPTGMARPSSAS